jgi:vanillate O-demethylase monooxygenase subunit
VNAPDLAAALACFWHPVCTLEELTEARPSGRGPLPVTLLDQRLAVAIGDDGPFVLRDRCIHRSTALSVGEVDGTGLRCAYHGWRFGPDGRCDDIPSMPDGPVPSRARVDAFRAAIAHGLVWVLLDDRLDPPVPACPAFDDPTLRVVAGAPYTWPTAAPRRVENFVDLAHFAFVHDGTLGRRDEPVPPLPEIARVDGELRFAYDPPDVDVTDTALFGHSEYRLPMPLTVNIDFTLESGARRVLWMTASPVTMGSCRSFWYVSRSDAHDEPDEIHMAFQDVVLAEDEPVVCAQNPPEIPLDPGVEVSIRTDKVSIEYRRWLRELAVAVTEGPEALAAALAYQSGSVSSQV